MTRKKKPQNIKKDEDLSQKFQAMDIHTSQPTSKQHKQPEKIEDVKEVEKPKLIIQQQPVHQQGSLKQTGGPPQQQQAPKGPQPAQQQGSSKQGVPPYQQQHQDRPKQFGGPPQPHWKGQQSTYQQGGPKYSGGPYSKQQTWKGQQPSQHQQSGPRPTGGPPQQQGWKGPQSTHQQSDPKPLGGPSQQHVWKGPQSLLKPSDVDAPRPSSTKYSTQSDNASTGQASTFSAPGETLKGPAGTLKEILKMPQQQNNGPKIEIISQPGSKAFPSYPSTDAPVGPTDKPETDREKPELTKPAGDAKKPPVSRSDSKLDLLLPIKSYKHIDSGFRPPARKDYGTQGRIIKLRANHVRIQLKLDNLHHYDIDITPEKIPKHLKRLIFQHMLDENKDTYFKGNTAFFDGQKNFYTVKRIPISTQEDLVIKSTVLIEDRKMDYKCKIKYAAEVNLYQLQEFWEGRLTEMPQDPVQAIDVAMKHCANLTQTPVGRSLYMPPSKTIDLGEGCELWMGRFQSVRPTQWKMTLNIDLAATAFYQPLPILYFICDFLKMRDPPPSLNPYQKNMLQKELRNLKVRVTHQGSIKRAYVVRELTAQPATTLKFATEKDGKKEIMTVAEYFIKQYGLRLKYPNMPCLRVGSLQKQIYLPMEVCELKSGQKKNRVSDLMVSNMIRHTARPAPEREAAIMEKLRDAKFNEDPIMKACGISVDNKLIELDGRVIEPPVVCYQSKQPQAPQMTVRPRMGVWDMRNGEHFLKPASFQNWALLVFEDPRRCSENSLRDFFQQLSRHAQTMGLVFPPTPLRVNYVRQASQADAIFSDYVESCKRDGKELQLIFVVLPGRSQIYAEIKRLGDIKYGLMTQCIQSRNIGRANPSLLTNVCLKLNVKGDGTNDVVNFQSKLSVFGREPFIIFGADVTHAAPGETRMPSIAAVVASMDGFPSKYTACVKAQGHRVEIIENLAEMIKHSLKRFYQVTNGTKPRKIIFYRDGVSEGQFLQVLQYEVQAIQEACRSIQKDYQPLITFAVVQKRHHTRLFCVNPRDACGKSQNIPPGTIVDRGIVHPRETDFFMCSHAGIQGTSRPTHYHILWDDNAYTQDEFQALTYALCHTYVRCNRAVSIPAPAYYAHHVAFRARYHLADLIHSDTASSSTVSSGGPSINLEKCNEAITIQKSNVEKMYFA